MKAIIKISWKFLFLFRCHQIINFDKKTFILTDCVFCSVFSHTLVFNSVNSIKWGVIFKIQHPFTKAPSSSFDFYSNVKHEVYFVT